MKKNNIIFCLLAGMALIGTACNSNTYSGLRDQEDRKIENYIRRQNLNITKDEPDKNLVWPEKLYYKVPNYDNFYFHLIDHGDTTVSVISNDVIVARYKKFGLEEFADTLSYWTTLDQAYPMEFHYGNTTECESVAWHMAVQLMKHPDAQCEIIVPSKLGFSDDQSSVTPYVYILKIKIKQ
jgi:hypothetical protein